MYFLGTKANRSNSRPSGFQNPDKISSDLGKEIYLYWHFHQHWVLTKDLLLGIWKVKVIFFRFEEFSDI